MSEISKRIIVLCDLQSSIVCSFPRITHQFWETKCSEYSKVVVEIDKWKNQDAYVVGWDRLVWEIFHDSSHCSSRQLVSAATDFFADRKRRCLCMCLGVAAGVLGSRVVWRVQLSLPVVESVTNANQIESAFLREISVGFINGYCGNRVGFFFSDCP